MTNIHQQRISETLYNAGKIQPAELAPILAQHYTHYSFSVARQQLQQLADTLSSISVEIAGFVMEASWERREAEDAHHQREVTRLAIGTQGEALLSVLQAAKILGVTKQKVYGLIKSGAIKAKDINEGTGKKPLLRLRASDLQ